MLRFNNLVASKPLKLNKKYPGGWMVSAPLAIAFTCRKESAKKGGARLDNRSPSANTPRPRTWISRAELAGAATFKSAALFQGLQDAVIGWLGLEIGVEDARPLKVIVRLRRIVRITASDAVKGLPKREPGAIWVLQAGVQDVIKHLLLLLQNVWTAIGRELHIHLRDLHLNSQLLRLGQEPLEFVDIG